MGFGSFRSARPSIVSATCCHALNVAMLLTGSKWPSVSKYFRQCDPSDARCGWDAIFGKVRSLVAGPSALGRLQPPLA